MKHVQITKDGIEGKPFVAESALPHYLGNGWEIYEPPPPVEDDESESAEDQTTEAVDDAPIPTPRTSRASRRAADDKED